MVEEEKLYLQEKLDAIKKQRKEQEELDEQKTKIIERKSTLTKAEIFLATQEILKNQNELNAEVDSIRRNAEIQSEALSYIKKKLEEQEAKASQETNNQEPQVGFWQRFVQRMRNILT